MTLLFPRQKDRKRPQSKKKKNKQIKFQTRTHDVLGPCAEIPNGGGYLLTGRVAYSRIGRVRRLRSKTLQIARRPAVLGVTVADLLY